jgi:hypothetical protein
LESRDNICSQSDACCRMIQNHNLNRYDSSLFSS